jgi:DNA-binding NarL/FixJ family response regulator
MPSADSVRGFRERRHVGLLMTGQHRVRILIADHQSAARSAVRPLLEERLEVDVVGEAADSQKLLAQLEQLRPDIIMLDQELPGWPSTRLSDALDGLERRPKVIVLGPHPGPMQEALAAGADAYVSKGDPPRRLLTAVRALSEEGRFE